MNRKKVTDEQCVCDHEHRDPVYVNNNASGGGAVYALGIFGAAFYYFPAAVGGEQFVLAILKSLAWPALLVFETLKLLKL